MAIKERRTGAWQCEGCGQVIYTEVEAVLYDRDGKPWHSFCMDESFVEFTGEAPF